MLKIRTFGDFCISEENKQLTWEALRSVKMLKLLVYLVYNREKELSKEDIIKALWQDEAVQHPAGALKNLVYRLRRILNGYFGEREYILTTNNGYSWNPELRVELDGERFEQLIAQAKKEPVPEQKIALYKEAIHIYRGEFLVDAADWQWASNRHTLFCSMYLSAMRTMAEWYLKKREYEELEALCHQAETVKEILEKELGQKKTLVLTKVYEELLARDK